MAGDHTDISKHVRLYIRVFVALAILTVATVGASMVDLPSHRMNIAVGLLIAIVKGSLVAVFFMHLKWDWGLKVISGTLMLCLVFFVFLMALPTLVNHDTVYLSRDIPPAAAPAEADGADH